MKNILIKNGTVIDPASKLNEKTDILIQGGVFSAIGNIAKLPAEYETVDASGLTAIPGLVDMLQQYRQKRKPLL